jgi:agmatinase
MPRKFFCSKDCLERSQIVLLGIPFDATSSFRPGSRFAPDAIRLYSEGIESYSPYQEKDLEDVEFYDAGNIEITISNFSALKTAVHDQVREFLNAEKKVIALGGEHLISLPVVEAYFQKYPDLKVVHFDAHADLRDEYLGEKYSHATVMKRICEVIGGRNIYQFGIRSGMKDEFTVAAESTNCYPFKIDVEGLQNVIEDLQGFPVYITLDFDVLDPSCFPGIGTPEPGGFTFHELLQALLLLKNLNIVGADLVELCPAYDRSDISTMTAIIILRELIVMMGK